MKNLFRVVVLLAAAAGVAAGADVEVATSTQATSDVTIESNPDAAFWKQAPVFAERNKEGKELPGYRTEIRSRWAGKYMCFLFVCPFEELFLKPHPATKTETNELWNLACCGWSNVHE